MPPKNEGKVGSHGFCTLFIDVTTCVFNKCLFEKQKSGPKGFAPVAPTATHFVQRIITHRPIGFMDWHIYLHLV